jgi:predicted transcriptional regulator
MAGSGLAGKLAGASPLHLLDLARARTLSERAGPEGPAAYCLTLPTARSCITVSYMSAVTIRLDSKLQRELDRLCRRLGRTRSEIVRDALRRQIALLRFDEGRRRLMPYAEAAGYLTDEDVFRDVS